MTRPTTTGRADDGGRGTSRPRRRLRTRLFLAMVALSMAVLLVSALVAVGLARESAASSALDDLRVEAPRIATQLEALGERFRAAAALEPSATRQASLNLSCRLVAGTVTLSGGSLLVVTGAGEFEDGVGGLLGDACADRVEFPDLPVGLRAADLDPARLARARVQEGARDGTAFVATPLTAAGDRTPVLVLSQDYETQPLGRAGRYLIWAAAGALLVAAAVAALLARRLTRPIAAMQATADRIAGGDLSARVGTRARPDDELASLARSIDAMAADLETAREHEHQFLLGVSHDLRTPLTSIRGYGEALTDGTLTTPAEQARAAEVITSESRRLERLVSDLLDLARLDLARLDAHALSLRPVDGDAAAVVRHAVDGLRPVAARWDVALEVDGPGEVPVVVDPERLAQIVVNLVENALKHAATSVRVSFGRDGDALVVTVDDDGPGIPAEERERIFDRLYTGTGTPARSVGTGIGLAVVRDLTRAMGGQVTCEPRAGGGTRFALRIPAAPGAEPGPPPRPSGA